MQAGDIIVAGSNWGCGSSREQAVTCLVQAGVRVLIAKSIARIYFRNAVNGGLLPILSAEAAEAIQDGERIRVDVEAHTIIARQGRSAFRRSRPRSRRFWRRAA